MAFTPKVSVVVPVYNAESCIEECIDSLLSLNYPKKSYDIIVVNNRSSDKTDSKCKHPLKMFQALFSILFI